MNQTYRNEPPRQVATSAGNDDGQGDEQQQIVISMPNLQGGDFAAGESIEVQVMFFIILDVEGKEVDSFRKWDGIQSLITPAFAQVLRLWVLCLSRSFCRDSGGGGKEAGGGDLLELDRCGLGKVPR